MWLKDLLPTYFPNPRIMTYAYPSEWLRYGKGTKTAFRDCGRQLHNEVKLGREAEGVCVHHPRLSLPYVPHNNILARLPIDLSHSLATVWELWL